MARQDLATKTVNGYLEAARCLFNWLVKQGRIGSNPLTAVEKVERRGADEYRRAFIEDEVRRLLDVASERRTVYLMAT